MIRFTAKMFGLEIPAFDNGRQLWVWTRLRKPAACRICRAEMPTSKHCWRPSSNASNRGDRVCSIDCLVLYEKEVKK